MDRLPSNIILDIFSRVPVKYLARSRCVSKVWCKYIDDPYLVMNHDKRVVDEPTPILYYPSISHERICFHVIESKQPGSTHYVLEPKEGPVLEYSFKEPCYIFSRFEIQVQGSCNGWMCLSQGNDYVITSLAVVHPLRKEFYELPPFPLRFGRDMDRESCGLGFDTSTNTYKMVCVLLKECVPPNKPDMVKKNLCTMVNVFGTNSWREIPQVPSYPITGKAVFANGCLHWLVSHLDIKTEDGGREVIWFDVNKEEFGLIDPPKRMCDLWITYSCYYDHLVDLNGEVGYVCCRTMEVWVLNKQKEWVPHCRFEEESVPDGYIDVIGCWNKDGDILIKCMMRGDGSSFMDRLPSNIIFNIFSRVPVKCLSRSRCVSKVWCSYIDDRYLTIIHDKRVVEEPTPILYHQHLSLARMTRSLCFHVTESIQTGTTHYVLEPKERAFLEYLHKKPLSRYSIVRIKVRGSCNGLICFSQDNGHVITSLVVIHPLRKECYNLPPFPLRFEKHMRRESCGLGFDTFTNTWKMVCVLLKQFTPPTKPDMVKKNLCTMVHVFGTNSWREIPQVSSYPISRKAVFANGCLHWLASYSDIKTGDGGREVIWFDVNKEEFGLIDPPRRTCDIWRIYGGYYDQVVDLNGEVGYVCHRTMEFWLLNHKKEWVPRCRFKEEIVPNGFTIHVIGCWNKDGDILIKSKDNGRYVFFVYNLKNGALHKMNIVGREDGCSPNIIMYLNDLLSIHGIITNSCSTKKTDI